MNKCKSCGSRNVSLIEHWEHYCGDCGKSYSWWADDIARLKLRIARLEAIRKAFAKTRRVGRLRKSVHDAMLNAPTTIHSGDGFLNCHTTTDYSAAFFAFKRLMEADRED